MTLLTKGIRYYFKCEYDHRFERGTFDAMGAWCPKCGGAIRLYGLKDSTGHDPTLEDVPGEEH